MSLKTTMSTESVQESKCFVYTSVVFISGEIYPTTQNIQKVTWKVVNSPRCRPAFKKTHNVPVLQESFDSARCSKRLDQIYNCVFCCWFNKSALFLDNQH